MSAIRELNATESGEDSTSRAARATFVGVSRLPFLGPIATNEISLPACDRGDCEGSRTRPVFGSQVEQHESDQAQVFLAIP